MTEQQTAELRESQAATIEAALQTTTDPKLRAYWERMRDKLAAQRREARDARTGQ